MNRVKLLFPDATIGEDADGQVLINTGVQIIGEGVTERFIPLEPKVEEPVTKEGKPEKTKP